MRELMLEADIARRINAPVGGLQEVVDDNACIGVVRNVGSFEVQPLDIGSPTDAGQDFIDHNAAFVVVTHDVGDFHTAFYTHRDDLGVEMNFDAVARQRIRQDLRGVALFLWQEHRIVLYDNDLRPQPAESLRQFAAKRTAADDQKTPRALGQVEDAYIGQVSRFNKPRY